MKITNSSNIKNVDFNKEKKILTVDFSDDSRYKYFDVEEKTFKMIEEANEKEQSIGKLFHSIIKGKYKHEKIEVEEEITAIKIPISSYRKRN